MASHTHESGSTEDQIVPHSGSFTEAPEDHPTGDFDKTSPADVKDILTTPEDPRTLPENVAAMYGQQSVLPPPEHRYTKPAVEKEAGSPKRRRGVIAAVAGFGAVTAGALGFALSGGGDSQEGRPQSPPAATAAGPSPSTTEEQVPKTTIAPTSTTEAAPTTTEVEEPSLGPIEFTSPVEGAVLLENDFQPVNLRGLAKEGYSVYAVPKTRELLNQSDPSSWDRESWQEYGRAAVPNFFALLSVAGSTNDAERVRELANEYLPFDESRLSIDACVNGGHLPSKGEYTGWGPGDTVRRLDTYFGEAENNITVVNGGPGVTAISVSMETTVVPVQVFEIAPNLSDPNHPSLQGQRDYTDLTLYFDSQTAHLVDWDYTVDPMGDRGITQAPGDYVYENGESRRIQG